MDQIVLPQVLDLGIFSLRWYGIILTLAAAAAIFVGFKRAKPFGISYEQVQNIFLVCIISGFLGARLWHVGTMYDYYFGNPGEILKIWNGGLAIYGAIFGGLVGLVIAKRYYSLQLSAYSLLDWLTPSLLVGQIIGRFGNWFNYELYGYPTNLPWKMFVPLEHRSPEFAANAFFHPLFLYESLGCLAILLALSLLGKKTFFQRPCTLFFSYFLMYNVLRFLIESLRIDTTFIGDFRLNYALSAGFVLISAVFIYRLHAHKET